MKQIIFFEVKMIYEYSFPLTKQSSLNLPTESEKKFTFVDKIKLIFKKMRTNVLRLKLEY